MRPIESPLRFFARCGTANRTLLSRSILLASDGRWSLDPSTIMRLFCIITLAAVVVGCASSSGIRRAPSDISVLDETKVLAIARQAVATNDTWLDRAEFETPKRQPDGSWSVLVWRLPPTPGGHRFISIDAKGRLTDYGRGL